MSSFRMAALRAPRAAAVKDGAKRHPKGLSLTVASTAEQSGEQGTKERSARSIRSHRTRLAVSTTIRKSRPIPNMPPPARNPGFMGLFDALAVQIHPHDFQKTLRFASAGAP
jgi:hypothetical protein